MQSSLSAEPSQPFSSKERENGAEARDGKSDLWKPLNCLVEVANRTKSLKSNARGSENKNENKHKSKTEDEKNADHQVSPENVKPKRLRRVRQKREDSVGESCISHQAVLDAATATGKLEKRIGPIWFSLVASEDQ